MEIVVKMDESEFRDFMEYRSDRGKYEANLRQVKGAPAMIARSLLNAVALGSEKSRKWKIVDQEHMDDAVSFAEELLESLGE